MIANIALVAILLVFSAASAQSCPEIRMQQGIWTGTPLHQAIYDNDVHAVKRLMSALTINKRDSFGNTPLVYALTPSEVLEPAGIVSASRKRALIVAENTARQAIVSALLSGGAAVNEPGARGVTPLMMLAKAGYALDIDRRLARKFLSAGADVDAKDDFGSTALIVAAQHRRTDLVKLLLSKGADSSITNCRGESAAVLLHIKN